MALKLSKKSYFTKHPTPVTDMKSKLKGDVNRKNEINDFFNNVIVNDEDIIIKKNRLELLNMLCKTFDNYFNFSKIEA